MFEVRCTGKNKNYGEAGEVRELGDTHMLPALKNDWIESDVKYIGMGKSTLQAIKVKLELFPVRKVDAIQVLRTQEKRLERIEAELKRIVDTNAKLMELLEATK